MTGRRAQAHTLEAFTAALLILAGVIFALQATVVTPLSPDTSNEHIENQHRAKAHGVLESAASNGTLQRALLHWNETEGRFVGATDAGYFTDGGPSNDFGSLLDETFGDATPRIAFNVFVTYRQPSNATGSQTVVYMGSPTDNAVAAATTVVLFDDAELVGPSSGTTVSESAAAGDFYAPDAAPNSTVFNVMEVRLVVWQM